MLDLLVPTGGRLSQGGVHSCLRAAASDQEAVLDLRASRWFEPIGLVAIAAFVEQAHAEGRSVQFLSPDSWNVSNYLSRMRLGLILEHWDVAHDLNPVRETDHSGELLELTRFEGEGDVQELAELLFEKMERVSLEAAQALHVAMSEIGANVPQHSGKRHGYVAAQTTYGGDQISFAVGDAGVGLLATLGSLGARNDDEAIRMAMEGGQSSTGTPGRGRGIVETVDLVTAARGHVHLLSGDTARTRSPTLFTKITGRASFGGTLLQGSFPCST